MINVLVLLGCTLFKLLFAILPPLNIAVASLTLPGWFGTWIDMPAFLALVTTFIVVWLAEYSVKIAVFLVKIIRG
jgi:hypothetical protein|nr:MAG TPA: hypothetical protein [Inoviridae sp.]